MSVVSFIADGVGDVGAEISGTAGEDEGFEMNGSSVVIRIFSV